MPNAFRPVSAAEAGRLESVLTAAVARAADDDSAPDCPHGADLPADSPPPPGSPEAELDPDGEDGWRSGAFHTAETLASAGAVRPARNLHDPPPPTRTRRTGVPKPDGRGRYLLRCGPAGESRAYRLPATLAPAEAAARFGMIRHVFDALGGRWCALAERTCADVAAGVRPVPVPVGHVWHAFPELRGCDVVEVRAAVRRLVPGVPWAGPAETAERSGHLDRLRATVGDGYRAAAELAAEAEAVPPPPADLPPVAAVAVGAAAVVPAETPARAVAGTFREQLARYREHAVAEGANADRLAKIKQLHDRHPDVPLAALDLGRCRTLFDLWRRRPPNRRTGKRYGAKRARQQLAELAKFLDWMHLDGSCDWRRPADLDRLSRKIDGDTAAEKAAKGTGIKKTLPTSAVGPALTHGDALDRLTSLLAWNTAGGAGEVGRWTWGNVHRPGPHPWAAEGIDAPPAEHGWVFGVRGKSGVAGAWPLWPETAGLLADWRIEAARRLGREVRPTDRVLLLTDGSPLYRDGASKNAQQTTANRWEAVWKRCGGEAAWPWVPFGDAHRSFVSNWTTRAGIAPHVAETVLAHGEPHPEGPLLFKHYSSKPWAESFLAVDRLGAELRFVVAEALAKPPHGA